MCYLRQEETHLGRLRRDALMHLHEVIVDDYAAMTDAEDELLVRVFTQVLSFRDKSESHSSRRMLKLHNVSPAMAALTTTSMNTAESC